MALPLMQKATAVWLVDNTKLTFSQIAKFCGLHELEVNGIADGEVASGIRKKLIINGSDYNTLDGTCVRDYLHVQDLAQAHVNSFQYVFNKNGKHIFNVGSGKGLSVLEIIKSFERVNNIDLDYTFGQRRNGDVEAIYSNGSLAKSELKWHPKISLDQAMLDAWNWEKQKK